MQPRMFVKSSQAAWVDVSKQPAMRLEQPSEIAQRAFVSQYTFALSMSQPCLSQDRRDLAYFTQDLYMSGEIDLSDFLGRMQRLFPERVALLSHMLRAKLTRHLKF